MEYFTKLNKKLDDGFKLTDVSCPTCKKTALFNPLDSTFQCINCETTLDFEVQSSSSAVPANSPPPPPNSLQTSSISPPPLPSNPPPSSSSVSRSNELSSKLAQKLLKGYTMLEECCPDCLVPLMRLKKEPAVCVGCDFEWLASSSSNRPAPSPSTQPPPSSSFQLPVSSKNDQKAEKNLDKPRALPPSPPSLPVISTAQPSSAIPNSPSINLIRDNLMEITSLLSSLYLEETKDIVKGKNLRGADNLINGALPQLIGLFNQLNNQQK